MRVNKFYIVSSDARAHPRMGTCEADSCVTVQAI